MKALEAKRLCMSVMLSLNPADSSETMKTDDFRFVSGGCNLTGTLTVPEQFAHAPVAILLPGSGHHDRDETLGSHKPFRTIADHFARHGIASLRFDARGVAESEGSIQAVNFKTKVADALAARDAVMERRGLSEHQVAFIGHSEGGLVAAAASVEQPTAVAMLAGPAVALPDLLHAQARAQSLAVGANNDQILHERRMNEEVFAVLLSQVSFDEAKELILPIVLNSLQTWPDQIWEGPQQIHDAANTMAQTVLADDFRSLIRLDPATILHRVTAPILAIFGELDFQVIGNANEYAFKEATLGHVSAQTAMLPRHNHLFQVATTGQIDEYDALGQSPSPETLARLTDWLKSILRGGP